ncbi:restriction endonuclease subunit S [Rhizobium leguminosarum]
MSLPGYSSYTDSGFGWLGEVPGHWSVRPLKYLVALRSGGTPSKAREDFWDGSVPWASAKDLKGERISDTEDHISEIAIDEGSIEINQASSILILVRGMMLARAFPVVEALVPMAINQDLKAINPKNGGVAGRFLAWTLRGTARESLDRCSEAGHGTKALRMEDWLTMPFPVPPLDEQHAIASFLDRETAKIDALVEEQRRLIALLKEKRQAVISHAVTKGLNPDAPMKDSGIEWLGEMPAHWEILPLRRSVRQFVDYRGATPNKVSDGVPLITASQIKNGRIDHSLDPVFISEDEYDERMTRGFPARGDLLLTTEAPLGEAALVEDERVAPGQRIIMMKVAAKKMTSGYLLAHFRSDFGQSELWTRSSGSTASGIRADRLRASLVLVPPLEEQLSIVQHIERQTASFEDAFNVANEAMRLLHERRTALISAAVTGKIDVRSSAEILALPVGRARTRGLIGAEIIERSAHQTTFGRVKLQKLAYLAEAHAGITELDGAYLREAAGPLDREMIREMEREAGALAGVRVEQPGGVGSAVTYRLGDRRGAHRQDLAALLGVRAARFDKLIEDIRTIDTKGAEAVATLFAVWNDALIDGETPADMEIKLAVLSEWHPEKAEKFTINELQIWLDWMRRHNLVPTGTGPKTTTGRLFA